ncbi:MAG: hypothetical protein V4726_03400 [Verrucomicrobiota bacterium]
MILFSATGWLLLGAPMVGAQGPGRDGRSGPVYDGWTSFYQPQYGFQLPVPPGVRAQGDPFTAKRAVFVSPDGDFTVTAWGGYAPGPTRPSLEEQWIEAQTVEDRRVDYRRWAGSWFEVSGVSRSGRAFYEKLIRRGEFYAVFTAAYTPSRLNEYRPWMDEMSAGFTYNATPPPRRINPDPDGLAEAQRKSGFRRFWSGLIDEKPEPRAAPRRMEPWDGGDGRDRKASEAGKPEYADGSDSGSPGGAPGEGGRAPRSTGPVDLTPPPAKPAGSPSTKPAATPPVTDSRDKNDRSTAPVPGVRPSEKPPEKNKAATKPPVQETSPASAKRDDLPFGIPIPGKKGFVYSPYNPDKGPVDVQDIPAGTKVRCPYTSKVFRVP